MREYDKFIFILKFWREINKFHLNFALLLN